jgi:hypothetical protein
LKVDEESSEEENYEFKIKKKILTSPVEPPFKISEDEYI